MRAAFVLYSVLLLSAIANAASSDAPDKDKAPGLHVEPDSPAAVKALADKPPTTDVRAGRRLAEEMVCREDGGGQRRRRVRQPRPRPLGARPRPVPATEQDRSTTSWR